MKFKNLISVIKNDLIMHTDRKKSLLLKFIIFFTNQSFQLLANYRISHYLKDTHFSFLNIFIRYINNLIMSSEISPYATIGKNIRFVHPTGVIIGYGVVIKDNIRIFQQVTIGAKGGIMDKKKKYPIISNNVIIYAKASIIGSVYVAENCIIGAHALLQEDTKSNGIYVGIPAKRISNVHV